MIIDMHFHVGLLGDRWPQWGRMSDWYRQQLVYKTFLLYARMHPDQVQDTALRDRTLETIETSSMDKVVCLALDPVYEMGGRRREDLSHFWVDNEYIIEELRPALPRKVLLGASVHPYDSTFKDRVAKYVEAGAVLLKWLPSAQQINPADDKFRDALVHLATAGKGGKPLPLLLHLGPEYAIPSSNPKTGAYDFFTWSWRASLANWLLARGKWRKPDTDRIYRNLDAGLRAGAVIILAHCGLPYFSIKGLFAEHSELKTVQRFLALGGDSGMPGKCYADVSALCTPFRKNYFSDIAKLPGDRLLFGSDFPTPAFELSAGAKEHAEDFKAIIRGDVWRVVIPEDNLLDVNRWELESAFPGHTMFGLAAEVLKVPV